MPQIKLEYFDNTIFSLNVDAPIFAALQRFTEASFANAAGTEDNSTHTVDHADVQAIITAANGGSLSPAIIAANPSDITMAPPPSDAGAATGAGAAADGSLAAEHRTRNRRSSSAAALLNAKALKRQALADGLVSRLTSANAILHCALTCLAVEKTCHPTQGILRNESMAKHVINAAFNRLFSMEGDTDAAMLTLVHIMSYTVTNGIRPADIARATNSQMKILPHLTEGDGSAAQNASGKVEHILNQVLATIPTREARFEARLTALNAAWDPDADHPTTCQAFSNSRLVPETRERRLNKPYLEDKFGSYFWPTGSPKGYCPEAKRKLLWLTMASCTGPLADLETATALVWTFDTGLTALEREAATKGDYSHTIKNIMDDARRKAGERGLTLEG